MKMFRLALPLLLSLLLLNACASTGHAPKTASGEKLEILVLSDKGDTAAMNATTAKAVDELVPFMEKDLVAQLNRAGFKGKAIKERSEFTPGSGRYLLTMRVTKYNPGSTAARMLVGFGAGAASLDNRYELFGSTPQPIVTWDDGVGTSQHWTSICFTLNSNTVRRINKQLGGS